MTLPASLSLERYNIAHETIHNIARPPLMLATQSDYDELGRPRHMTDASGVTREMQYIDRAASSIIYTTGPGQPDSFVIRDHRTGHIHTGTAKPGTWEVYSLTIDHTDVAGRVIYSDRYATLGSTPGQPVLINLVVGNRNLVSAFGQPHLQSGRLTRQDTSIAIQETSDGQAAAAGFEA